MISLRHFFYVVLLYIFFSYPAECKKRYDNFTVYKIIPKTENGLKSLQYLMENHPEFSFWSSIRGLGIPVDIMVPPSYKIMFKNIVENDDFSTSVMISNVQEKIDNEGLRPLSEAGSFDLKSYHTLDEIYDWLRNLSIDYPDKVKLLNIGKTYEQRDILGVKLSFKNVSQKAVFLESNIHGKEWISGAVNLYILNELLTSTNDTVRKVAESHDWYIFPITNPDAFVYTYTEDRFWKKTRIPYKDTTGVICYGADPERNWDFVWGQAGASNRSCWENYRGPKPFSEPCTKALSSFISTVANDLVAYISFHSYSQYIMLPYGHTADNLDNFDQMYPVGEKAKTALAYRYNTEYVVGNMAQLHFLSSGNSVDWVKGTYHTPIVFTYSLRDRGRHGFVLPADQIIPSGEETLDSLLVLITEGEKAIKI